MKKNSPIAATVEDPFSLDVHQTSPTSKPRPAQAACKYALTRSGSMFRLNNLFVDREAKNKRTASKRSDRRRSEFGGSPWTVEWDSVS
jgi:hypothetical protein